jgi:hypothetical protein
MEAVAQKKEEEESLKDIFLKSRDITHRALLVVSRLYCTGTVRDVNVV